MKPLELLSFFKLVEAVPTEVIPAELKDLSREALTGMIMMITVAAENVERTPATNYGAPVDATPYGPASNPSGWTENRAA